jgi:hypothetical protein
MDTVPLPAVPSDAPGPPRRPRPSGAGRFLEALAGLASAGLLLIGLGLVVLQLIAPELAPGTGMSAAAGPTWWRALAHVGVGAAGELCVWARPRMGRAARVWGATATLLMTAAVLWLAWWR